MPAQADRTAVLVMGALLRRQTRTYLDARQRLGALRYREEKRFIESAFFVTASPAVLAEVKRLIDRLNAPAR
ncbi:hypothetical protein ADL27_63355 [Streptomyces sp. NRRL F-6602]|nr:hypothetical protein ADL27_63355 [Streptomyces sp. NRRL F-6602]